MKGSVALNNLNGNNGVNRSSFEFLTNAKPLFL